MKKQKGVINQTHKNIKLNNDLLDYWDSLPNKNKRVNELLTIDKNRNNES